MRFLALGALAFAAPTFVTAALFGKDSLVKQIDAKQFRTAMRENRTSVVAFVAPWCGHCQRMAPELNKAALGLHPLIPVYAVDCDADKNKRLCAEQGVQGFPTVKLFPRGKDSHPIPFNGPERTASAFFYWAKRRVPNKNKKLYHTEDILPWTKQGTDKDRLLLLSKAKELPLLWQVLANKYRDDFEFASHRDRKGKTSVALGFEAGGKKEAKVLLYQKGTTKPFRFEGLLKLDSLSKFLDSVIDGTADLAEVNEAAKEEEYVQTAEEEEIERQQEAQRIALAHGGFTELIDFEEAIKKYGTDFHDAHGFGGGMMMGEMPKKTAKSEDDAAASAEGAGKPVKEEDPIHRILKAQKEREEKKKAEKDMPKTGDGAQVVMHADEPTATAASEAAATPATTESVADPEPEEAPLVEELAEDEEPTDDEDAEDDAPEPEPAATPESETAEKHKHEEL